MKPSGKTRKKKNLKSNLGLRSYPRPWIQRSPLSSRSCPCPGIFFVSNWFVMWLLNNLFGHYYVVKWKLTQLITRSAAVGQRSLRWLKRRQAWLHHLHVLSPAFSGGLSLRLAFGSFFYPYPFILSTDKSVWQVPGSIGLCTHDWRALVYQPWGRNSV